MATSMRAGRISSVNFAKGKASVTYADKNGAVTRELPFLVSDYAMPAIGDMVMVLHLDTDTTRGLILGQFYSETNVPIEGAAGLYRKEFSKSAGKAMLRFTEEGGLTIKAGNISFVCDAGSTTMSSLITAIASLSEKIAAAESRISALESKP